MSSSSTTNNDNQAQMPTLSEHLPKEQNSSSSTPVAPQDPKVCSACYGEEELIELPCDHSWCPDCITRASSLVISERHWPMRCGEECWIPEDIALEALPKEEARCLKARLKEFKTPERERCYCANTQCNKFILPGFVNIDDNLAHCGECSTATCTLCRREQHEGPCAGPSEEETQAIDLMKSQGYQKCTQCNRVVERMEGCPHMTCFCGYEFCYHCGSQIKVCNGCWHLEPDATNFLPAVNYTMTHMQEGLANMLARNLAHPNAPNTHFLNMIMVNNGYRGEFIFFDAQGSTLLFDANLDLPEEEVEISDRTLWQMIKIVLESEAAMQQQEETPEAEWDRLQAQNREEQQEAREAEDSWTADWDM